MQTQNIKKIVLAYSGGLDTSAIIPWLKENYGGCEVVAFVADIGQERGDLEGVEKKALQSGASECHVVDLREEFISDYVYPVLQTGALYEGTYLLGTSMARPIIAKAQVELALKVGADALCHGATGKGNDQVRFETTYTALAPQLKVVAPWREWNLRSREALLDYLKERNIPTTASLEKIYSRDENAWHISTEGGVLESPANAPNKDCWVWTVDPLEAPDQPEDVTVTVEKGRVRDSEAVMVITLLQRRAQLHQMSDRLMHQFNGVDTACRIAGMARFPLDANHIRQMAFVRAHRFKRSRFTDDGTVGTQLRRFREIFGASHGGLFIGRGEDIERFAQRADIHIAQRVENKGEEAFHVCCAQAVELVVVLGQGKGIARPAAIIKGNGIRMTG